MTNLLPRAGLLTLVLCALLQLPATGARAGATAEPATLEWKFRVLLDDREIGFHDFRLTDDGEQRRVEIDASFDVRILFLTAYRYRHRNVELWNDDCLTAIESSTDDNGSLSEVQGTSTGDQFLVQAGDTQATLDECVMSFAYWNPRLLQTDQLLNSQTGEVQPVTIEPRGDTLLWVDGAEVPARRYDLSVGGTVISLWYSAGDYRWLALETQAAGGRILRYEPVLVPLSAPFPTIARGPQSARGSDSARGPQSDGHRG